MASVFRGVGIPRTRRHLRGSINGVLIECLDKAVQTERDRILKALPEKGIKWMQEGYAKNRKGYTEGFNTCLDAVKKVIDE